MLIDLDRRSWGQLAMGLAEVEKRLKGAGSTLTPDLAELYKVAVRKATENTNPDRSGQERSNIDQGPRERESRSMNPLLLTYEAAAELLQASERTVRRLVADGSLPVVEVVGARRIRVADLESFIEQRTTTKESA